MAELPLSLVASLTAQHETAGFDCGVPALNEYLVRYAWQNHHRYHSARTYVVARGLRVVAYHTLAYGSVSKEEAPPAVSRGVGRYPVPVLVLGRLAVHVGEHGQGLGKALLRDALLRAAHASDTAGLRAVLVHAQDERVKPFYRAYGFEPFPGDSLTLFLSIEEILRHRGPEA